MKKKFLITLSIIISIVVVFILAEFKWHLMRSAYDRYVLDNKISYLSCEEMPLRTEIADVLNAHQKEVNAITRIGGVVELGIEDKNGAVCADRGKLVIRYGGDNQKRMIEKTIGSNKFFGIPYDLINN